MFMDAAMSVYLNPPPPLLRPLWPIQSFLDASKIFRMLIVMLGYYGLIYGCWAY